MQVVAIINNVGIKISVDVNIKNCLKKENAIKELFGILYLRLLCDKSSGMGEHVDYGNRKRKKSS